MEQCDPQLIDYKGQSQNDQGKKHFPARNKSAGRTKKKNSDPGYGDEEDQCKTRSRRREGPNYVWILF